MKSFRQFLEEGKTKSLKEIEKFAKEGRKQAKKEGKPFTMNYDASELSHIPLEHKLLHMTTFQSAAAHKKMLKNKSPK